jgi:hypothetical protein
MKRTVLTVMYMAAVTMFTACDKILPELFSTVTGVVISTATASVERKRQKRPANSRQTKIAEEATNAAGYDLLMRWTPGKSGVMISKKKQKTQFVLKQVL